MLKANLALCGLATALFVGPAMAQTNAPATTAPATPAPTVSAPAAGATGQTQFFTNLSSNQWRASKFVGVDVYGANNEKIGDVNDIIIDNQGNINAVVIGVGGFLGIGEKDVAIPFKTVEWMMQDRSASAARNTSAMGTNSAAPSTSGAMGTNANNTAANNTAAGTSANTDVTGTTVSSTSNAYPDHGVLRMTKQDLQNAPSFRYSDQANAKDTGGTVNPVPSGTKQ